ncbi:MAG: hypothetical protein CMJ98_06715 [Planctomycetes bacterium]|jgi:mono/diheme cytochrome c family protein|nr:hypothetical protein [Planctomycetota bacterium]MBV21526.1 hypothetical protein [Planctomycetaceae bacterium]HJM56526.1 c-type cytochrome [Planctomycetota bacterium]
MRGISWQGLAVAFGALGLLTSLQTSEDENPHARAPRDVSLVVTEGAWLRAPGADWFAQRAKAEPGRFTHDATAAGGAGGWVDSHGEYSLSEIEGEWAYWQWASAERLTDGRQDFVQFCSSCHGLNGDGYGRSGQHLRPTPRSFQQNKFKFTKVTADLPSDEALLSVIKRGLAGTPMLPWDLSDVQLLDIIQYIKSLSPEESGWRDVYSQVGDAIEVTEDPWTDTKERAIVRGREIYHGAASCHLCHPGYVTNEELRVIRKDPEGTTYRENLTYPALKDSEYEVLGRATKVMPPDFTWHQMRAGTTTADLFQTIASGIKGTAMPQWKGAISDEDLWALAHYVENLIVSYKDQPAARSAFMGGLRVSGDNK